MFFENFKDIIHYLKHILLLDERKFAGRAMAPEPTFAPPPPASWQADIKEPQKIVCLDLQEYNKSVVVIRN